MIGYVPLSVVDDEGKADITRFIGVVQIVCECDDLIPVFPSAFAVDGVHRRPVFAVLAERNDQIHRAAQACRYVRGKLQAPARNSHQVFQINDHVAPVAADKVVQCRVGKGVRCHLLTVDEHKFVFGGRIGFQCAFDDFAELFDLHVHAFEQGEILTGAVIRVIRVGVRLRRGEIECIVVNVHSCRFGFGIFSRTFAVFRIDVGADFVNEVEGFLRIGK